MFYTQTHMLRIRIRTRASLQIGAECWWVAKTPERAGGGQWDHQALVRARWRPRASESHVPVESPRKRYHGHDRTLREGRRDHGKGKHYIIYIQHENVVQNDMVHTYEYRIYKHTYIVYARGEWTIGTFALFGSLFELCRVNLYGYIADVELAYCKCVC